MAVCPSRLAGWGCQRSPPPGAVQWVPSTLEGSRGADALDARGIGECAELALGAPPKCVRRSGDRYAESRVGLSVTWKLSAYPLVVP